MKILFVTDLHGSRWKYDRLFELAKKSYKKSYDEGTLNAVVTMSYLSSVI